MAASGEAPLQVGAKGCQDAVHRRPLLALGKAPQGEPAGHGLAAQAYGSGDLPLRHAAPVQGVDLLIAPESCLPAAGLRPFCTARRTRLDPDRLPSALSPNSWDTQREAVRVCSRRNSAGDFIPSAECGATSEVLSNVVDRG